MYVFRHRLVYIILITRQSDRVFSIRRRTSISLFFAPHNHGTARPWPGWANICFELPRAYSKPQRIFKSIAFDRDSDSFTWKTIPVWRR